MDAYCMWGGGGGGGGVIGGTSTNEAGIQYN